jgi:hypothetical protein
MSGIRKLWKAFWYRQVEIHAIDVNGVVCVSEDFYKELEQKSSLSGKSTMLGFFGVEVVKLPHLPYTTTRKRFSL